MRSPKVPLIAIGATLALIGAFALATSGPAYTQSGQPVGPNVKVINTPSEPVPVTLQGTTQIDTANPIPVFDIDSGARDPGTGESEMHLLEGGIQANATLSVVPEGKRFVIEYVSAAARMGGNVQRARLVIRTITNGVVRKHFIAFGQANEHFDANTVASQAVRIYADPGSVVSCTFFRDGNPFFTADCSVTLSGHYVTL